MVTTWLLVHSPLLGPSSWSALAGLARAEGIQVEVPDLTGVVDAPAPRWRWIVDTAAAAATDRTGPVAVLGHSGAGAFLPAIGDRLPTSRGPLVFVDAVVPPAAGAHRTPQGLRELLDTKTRDGRLLPWLDWWPRDTLDDLLPQAGDRMRLAQDAPLLPRDLYDEAVPVPEGWSTWPCAYLRLSPAYDAEYAQAGERGWSRTTLEGTTHLSIHTDATRVLDAVLDTLASLGV